MLQQVKFEQLYNQELEFATV